MISIHFQKIAYAIWFDNIGVFTSHLHKHCPKQNFPKSAMPEWQAYITDSLNKRRRLRHRYRHLKKNPTDWPRPPFMSTKPSCYQLKSIVRNYGDHGHLRVITSIFLHKTQLSVFTNGGGSLFPPATSENLKGNHRKRALHANVGEALH